MGCNMSEESLIQLSQPLLWSFHRKKGRQGFILFYEEGFIGCGRLIKSLTLELRWGVKAGDKGIDEEGWDFLCVYECGCASFGLWIIFHKSSGHRGENWTGITASQCCVPVTHRETLPVLKSLRGQRGEDERDIMLSHDNLLERLNRPSQQDIILT